jgi:hypothetical protein
MQGADAPDYQRAGASPLKAIQAMGINPYKRQQSFEVEDAGLFFGRERETSILVARILATRITVLCAPSGAGKTSLLNARIIPGLEAHGWAAVRSKPSAGQSPVLGLRDDALYTTFPPLESELTALARMQSLLDLPDTCALDDLLTKADALMQDDFDRWRALVAPVRNAVPKPGELDAVPFESTRAILPAFHTAMPYLCRVLRNTMEVQTYGQHLAALRNEHAFDTLTGDTTLSSLRELLDEGALRDAYVWLVTWLHASTPGLRVFCTNLLETYGRCRTGFSMVLLLDQFEEIFTLFTDDAADREEGTVSRGSFGRLELFEELRDLYRTSPASDRHATASSPPAIGETPSAVRCLLSLREEYVGRLTPLRNALPELFDSMYRLAWLSQQDAELAIREPAGRHGYDYTDECVNAVLADIPKEDGMIKPGPLQIVCYRAWENRPPKTGVKGLITSASLGKLGVKGIWTEFFAELYKTFTFAEQLALLDIFHLLTTRNGTRDIVERERLFHLKYWHPEMLAGMLERLGEERIIRIEKKPHGEFCEIMHEFLLEPVRKVRSSHQAYFRIERAFDALERSAGEVERDVFDALNEDWTTNTIEWHTWMTGVMFRTAVVQGRDAVTIRKWSARYEQQQVSVEKILNSDGADRRRTLTVDELAFLASHIGAVKTRHAERVLRSLIESPGTFDRAFAANVARRLDDHPDGAPEARA